MTFKKYLKVLSLKSVWKWSIPYKLVLPQFSSAFKANVAGTVMPGDNGIHSVCEIHTGLHVLQAVASLLDLISQSKWIPWCLRSQGCRYRRDGAVSAQPAPWVFSVPSPLGKSPAQASVVQSRPRWGRHHADPGTVRHCRRLEARSALQLIRAARRPICRHGCEPRTQASDTTGASKREPGTCGPAPPHPDPPAENLLLSQDSS